MNGHQLIVRLFKYCVRTSNGKTVCSASCRIFQALANVIDVFCDQNEENQKTLLPLISPFILEYEGGGSKVCQCDNDAFLQVKCTNVVTFPNTYVYCSTYILFHLLLILHFLMGVYYSV
jgi:hypothetical protein